MLTIQIRYHIVICVLQWSSYTWTWKKSVLVLNCVTRAHSLLHLMDIYTTPAMVCSETYGLQNRLWIIFLLFRTLTMINVKAVCMSVLHNPIPILTFAESSPTVKKNYVTSPAQRKLNRLRTSKTIMADTCLRREKICNVLLGWNSRNY